MRRKTKLIVSAVSILVLLGVIGTTTMSATTEYVSPRDVQSGEYEGQWVNLEGVVKNLHRNGETIRFVVTGDNASVPVVYNGTMPETLGNGRIVVATGVVEDGHLEAEQITVRAHEGSNN
ncbi:MAG: cytochrome c maturation protein CcmE [Halodesulfurarchaeum sp.]